MTLMIILMFGVMYFVMIRPQRKQKEEAEKLRTSLKAGDNIVTIGGIHGVIERVNKSTVHILTADKTLMEFSTESILRRVEAENPGTDAHLRLLLRLLAGPARGCRAGGEERRGRG